MLRDAGADGLLYIASSRQDSRFATRFRPPLGKKLPRLRP